MITFRRLLILLFLCSCGPAPTALLAQRSTRTLVDWSFRRGNVNYAASDTLDDGGWEQVRLPHTYSLDAINDVGYYRGPAWYRTRLGAPPAGRRSFLRFAAAGQEAEVYVNGRRIGTHRGGYSAFCFEITEELRPGAGNLLAVRVSNAPDFHRIPVTDALFNAYGGLYRPVQLLTFPTAVFVDPAHHATSGLFVTTDSLTAHDAYLTARLHLAGRYRAPAEHTLSFTVYAADGREVATTSSQRRGAVRYASDGTATAQLRIPDPVRWHGRRNPYRYRIVARVEAPGGYDEVSEPFGLREYQFSPERGFILNGEPYPLHGVCRHEEWRDRGPALLADHHRADLATVADIGATALRLAHYQQSDLVYELADSLGILVWAEIPFVHDYSGREEDNARQQLRELILQQYNRPSVFVWGLWNEVRAYRSPEEDCVGITRRLNALARELDPRRPTVSASDRGMVSNMGNLSDLQAWNKYFGWYYGQYTDLATWLDESHRDFPDRPLAISEYGIGGNVLQQDTARLDKPAGNYFPEPEQTRYHEIAWPILRERPFVWGTFVWNLFDFSVAGWNRGGVPNLNHKGLVTFDRRVRKDAYYYYRANWNPAPTLYLAGRRNDRRAPVTDIKLFTNLDNPRLTINGEAVGRAPARAGAGVVTWAGVRLRPGENRVRVAAGALFDEMVLRVD